MAREAAGGGGRRREAAGGRRAGSVTVQGAGGFMGGTLHGRDACGCVAVGGGWAHLSERLAVVRAAIVGQAAPARRKARA